MIRIQRRQLLVGAAGLVLMGCASPRVDTDVLVPISGDAQLPGEPLWSAKSNAFLVAVSPKQLEQLRNVGPTFAGLGASGFVALANECPRDFGMVGSIGWCQGDRYFACSVCETRWDETGLTINDAPRGLTHMNVTVNEAGDVLIDKAIRTAGVKGPKARSLMEPKGVNLKCGPFFAVP